MKRFLIFLCLTLSVFLFFLYSPNIVKADELESTIDEQIENIDLSEIEKIFNDEIGDFRDTLKQIIAGKYNLDSNNIFISIKDKFLSTLKDNVPLIITISMICIIISIFSTISKDNLDTTINTTINFIALCIILVLLSGKIISEIVNTYKTLEKIVKINEIFSPILLTLMLTTGGSISCSIYSPTTVLISSFINNFILKLIFPALIIMLILIVLSYFSDFNIKGYKDLIATFIKWSIGLFGVLFTIFLSIQGITSGIRDGISIKTTKYILSSSMPIIGGIVGGGVDFLLYGGLIIKNSIGFLALILIFSICLKPIFSLIFLSFTLKCVSVVSETFLEKNISELTKNLSSFLNFLIAIIVITSLIFIIYIFLIIISANAFI